MSVPKHRTDGGAMDLREYLRDEILEEAEAGYLSVAERDRRLMLFDSAVSGSAAFLGGGIRLMTNPAIATGSGVGVTVRDILTELFAYLEREEAPIFSGTKRSGDPAGYEADIFIARSLGWQPRIERHKGLCEYADWFRNGAL